MCSLRASLLTPFSAEFCMASPTCAKISWANSALSAPEVTDLSLLPAMRAAPSKSLAQGARSVEGYETLKHSGDAP